MTTTISPLLSPPPTASFTPSRALRESLPFAIAMYVPFAGLRLANDPSWQRALILPTVIFIVMPLLDLVCGRVQRQLVPEAAAKTGRDWRFDLWLWLWVPLELLAIGWFLTHVHRGELPTTTLLACALAFGLVTGIGINVAHELMHRRGRFERALAEILMTCTTYTHFCVEHVLGHHKHVSTPEDPASSRLGQSLYAYLPQTLLGGLRSAWRLEGARVARVGIPRWSLRNRRLRYPLVLAVVYASIFLYAGVEGVIFFALQSAVAMVLLETINYIEHYGLSRRRLPSGRYERTTPAHSWNASERLTNWFLFHLQRHADHHHLASRPFYALRHIEESPQLPTGYAGMIVLSLVPPLWRRVMDPRVEAWRTHSLTSAEPPDAASDV